MNIEEILEQVKQIAKDAGRFMVQGEIHTIQSKGGISNIVTDMDVKTQTFIMERVIPLVANASVFAEEKQNQVLSDDYTWIIDPIDGTTNYAYDFHHSCVSIALAKDKEPILGVCYNPYLDELFYGAKGMGAFVNGTPLHVSHHPMASSLILCGTSPYKKEVADMTFACLKDLFLEGRDLRRSGSAVLDLCYVAAGRVDAFYEESLSFWDYAAASLLIKEAGGEFHTMNGPWGNLEPVGFLAGNQENIQDLRKIIAKHHK